MDMLRKSDPEPLSWHATSTRTHQCVSAFPWQQVNLTPFIWDDCQSFGTFFPWTTTGYSNAKSQITDTSEAHGDASFQVVTSVIGRTMTDSALEHVLSMFVWVSLLQIAVTSCRYWLVSVLARRGPAVWTVTFSLLPSLSLLLTYTFHSSSTPTRRQTEAGTWAEHHSICHTLLHPTKSISAQAKRGWGLERSTYRPIQLTLERELRSDRESEAEMKEKKWKITRNMTALMSFTIRNH